FYCSSPLKSPVSIIDKQNPSALHSTHKLLFNITVPYNQGIYGLQATNPQAHPLEHWIRLTIDLNPPEYFMKHWR
ncbi:hypothetical protein AB4486_28350, partial [Vibrio sp. 10N.222.55.C6]|uniref:hypothetical protein n=1 Tax=Vibrio sp. 10N.222.55.C6 TaxID=3229649 RepID=UPI00355110D0